MPGNSKHGRYFKSKKALRNATGKAIHPNWPSIHVGGSVRGMRKLFWGDECDVVRAGNYIYRVSD